VFISTNTGAAHAGVFEGFSSYVSSKVGEAQLVTFLQKENPEVRVVSFHPGVLATEMNDKSGLPLSYDDMSLPSGFAVWLASRRADWVGGRFLWSIGTSRSWTR
jgi:NAD(P)-dependent dehydrogenase (short-subunit alcohol dehydrogenase family)